MMDDEEMRAVLTALCVALYGPRWTTAFARANGINPRTVRRWASGERPVPSWAISHARILTHGNPESVASVNRFRDDPLERQDRLRIDRHTTRVANKYRDMPPIRFVLLRLVTRDGILLGDDGPRGYRVDTIARDRFCAALKERGKRRAKGRGKRPLTA